SGITYSEDDVPHIADPNFVRGNSWLWKKKCFDEAGYIIAHTADTVSVALAHLKGWKTKTLKSAHVSSRAIDVRLSSSKSKGYHAYYRRHTLFYLILEFIHFSIVKRRISTGSDFFIGYINGMINKKPRIENAE